MPLQNHTNYYIFGFMTIYQKPTQVWVFTSKSAFMQRLSDYARTGHNWYVKGTIPKEKLLDFYGKKIIEFPLYDDKLKAFRARKDGKTTGRILFWMPKEDSKIHFVVLLQGKESEVKDLAKKAGEQIFNVEDKHHILNLTHYELVKEQRETTSKEGKTTQKMAWTWRYEKKQYEDLRDHLIYSLRSGHDHDVKNAIKTLSGTVGFAGSRKQIKSIYELFTSEWKRNRPNQPMPVLPTSYWVRRKGDVGIFLKTKDLSQKTLKTIDDLKYDQIDDLKPLTASPAHLV